jgi:predicted esterase
MTREDRDQAIADNIAYVDSAIARISTTARQLNGTSAQQHHSTSAQQHHSTSALVMVGFSQGAAMAYRAALMGARPAAGIIALAGDIPPELKTDAPTRHPWPRVLIGVGSKEQWYSGAKLDADMAFLSARGIIHSVVRFDGGHEWTEEFRNAAGAFLAAL